MSTRHRAIAGAPERAASETATTVIEMIQETLGAASGLDLDLVAAETEAARAAIRMLIAGKHLGDDAIVLVAEPLRLEITVVSGDAASRDDDKLGRVPGAATATAWSLHLPAPAPVGSWVEDAVRGLDHVTTDPPPAEKVASAAAAVLASDIDLGALRRAAGGAA
ncbi:MAG TPA: hypothetical protein VF587_03560 [Solirubrobacteraceae bacterium]|jgi:hypothetical protein